MKTNTFKFAFCALSLLFFSGMLYSQSMFEQKLEISSPQEWDRFGGSTAIHKDKMVMRGRGSAYFYKFQNDTWELQQILNDPSSSIYAISCDMDNEFAVIGDRKAHNVGIDNPGAVFVYEYNGEQWEDATILAPNDPQEQNDFGMDVKIENDLIVVGAHHYDETGAVYLFRYEGCEWVQEAKLSPSDGLASDNFGWRISLFESKIIVGTFGGFGAYIFEKVNDVWTETAIFKIDEAKFGGNVHITENHAYVSSELATQNGVNESGAVYRYKKEGQTWIEDGIITSPSPVERSNFGARMTSSESKFIISADRDENDGNGAMSGAAYVYNHVDAIETEFLYKLSDPDGVDYDRYAARMDIYNDNILISALDADSGTSRSTGHAYVYYNEVKESLVLDTIIPTHPLCDEGGFIEVYGFGGMPPYSYSIDNGENFYPEPLFEDLEAGDYFVSIKDSEGCIHRGCVELLILDGPEIVDVGMTQANCNEPGTITVDAIGGFDLEYSIDGINYQVSNEFEGLPNGSYIIYVRDFLQCTVESSIDLPDNNNLSINNIMSSPSQCNSDSGALLIEATGIGSLEYSIDAINYQTENEFSNISSGSYIVTVRDSMNCEVVMDAEIMEEDGLILNLTDTTTPTCGEDNGSISLEYQGEIGEISILLNDEPFTQTDILENLSSGEYHIIIEDEAECRAEKMVSLESSDCSFFIPNIFSPDGDGNNDDFHIFVHDGFNGSFTSLRIYDRWGEMIYEKLDFNPITDSWDGFFNGEKIQPSVCVVAIEYLSQSGVAKYVTQTVTLVE